VNTTLRSPTLACAGLILACMLSPRAAAQPRPDPQVGFDLLDRLVSLVVRSAAPGGVTVDTGQETVLLARDLRAAHEVGRVDDLFAVRYGRLLSAVRQAVLMDPEMLYWPMYRYTMVDFIEERTGRIPEWEGLLFIVNDHGGAGVGLGTIADAVISEVVTLHLHLENLSRRAEIKQGYLERGIGAARPGA
jgi:hypothetical protein